MRTKRLLKLSGVARYNYLTTHYCLKAVRIMARSSSNRELLSAVNNDRPRIGSLNKEMKLLIRLRHNLFAQIKEDLEMSDLIDYAVEAGLPSQELIQFVINITRSRGRQNMVCQ